MTLPLDVEPLCETAQSTATVYIRTSAHDIRLLFRPEDGAQPAFEKYHARYPFVGSSAIGKCTERWQMEVTFIGQGELCILSYLLS